MKSRDKKENDINVEVKKIVNIEHDKIKFLLIGELVEMFYPGLRDIILTYDTILMEYPQWFTRES